VVGVTGGLGAAKMKIDHRRAAFVVPAKGGTHLDLRARSTMGSGFRRNDGLRIEPVRENLVA
jgi:hypothetical protein